MTTSLTALALALALAVPTKDGAKESDAPAVAPTGPAPRLLFVKADADGKVRLPGKQPANGGVVAMQIQVGGAPGAPAKVIQQAFSGSPAQVELKDLKEVAVTTTGGTKVDVAEAARRLATGGFVLLPSDGKAISPEWLRLFRSESVLVVTSPDLATAPGATAGFIQGGVGGAGGAWALPVQPLPAPAPAVPPPAPKNE